ncbi:spore germination protein KA [Paenibacillus endophyticus]|uniref:Spore germination protein KA n=1 Tax=Paenibacillus endophyticus TaxID=1294268 RepID=A0A7W5C5R2_9BACL|nr:spore germination protein [Paenibacillus endophyticus]MBB3151543.1 spore germination protein KA [Paenibacillus endophyticus]
MNAIAFDHDQTISPHIEKSRVQMEALLKDCSDAAYLECKLGGQVKGIFCYFNGLTNEERLNEIRFEMSDWDIGNAEKWLESVEQEVTSFSCTRMESFTDMMDQMTLGNSILLVDGFDFGFVFSLSDWRKRAIEDPVAESVIRGPREGFTESLDDNMAMLRRRIRKSSLKMKGMVIGDFTKTRIVIGYIEELAAPELIKEIEERLSAIKVDGILESGNIEEYIEDEPYSPFPQMISTERPDTVAAGLLEGRAVIFTDNTPFALVAPISLFSLLQSPEDYYQRFLISTFIRWLRYLFFLVALLVPSAYVALLTYHQEMIPSALLLSIAKSRESIPFPALVEAFIMETMFEALREAGVRLPKQVGAAVSIVGALVIGQAATSAGLVSSPMVMVVAITGIASFLLPHYSIGISIRLLRFPIMLMAGVLGLLGLLLGVIGIVIHLSGLRSFGVPYLSPIAPMMVGEWKDVVMRPPGWVSRQRPKFTRSGGGFRKGARRKNIGTASNKE